MPGPDVRSDIVEVYPFWQEMTGQLQFLQLLRASDSNTAADTWQPVMGHIKKGESALTAALRELEEETRITKTSLDGFWQLEQPDIYFLHEQNCMILAPCFAARLSGQFSPDSIKLNREHQAFRWVDEGRADESFLWAGQRTVVKQIAQDIAGAGSSVAPFLRIRSEPEKKKN